MAIDQIWRKRRVTFHLSIILGLTAHHADKLLLKTTAFVTCDKVTKVGDSIFTIEENST